MKCNDDVSNIHCKLDKAPSTMLDCESDLTHHYDHPCLSSWEAQTTTSRGIVLLRIDSLKNDAPGFAAALVPMLQHGVTDLLRLRASKPRQMTLDQAPVTLFLKTILWIHLNCTTIDPTLGKEIARHGSHVQLVKLIRQDPSVLVLDEAEQDSIMELQEVSCRIAALGVFPEPWNPFTIEDLRHRLPLVFHAKPILSDFIGVKAGESVHVSVTNESRELAPQTVLIHQITDRQSAQEDVGFGT